MVADFISWGAEIEQVRVRTALKQSNHIGNATLTSKCAVKLGEVIKNSSIIESLELSKFAHDDLLEEINISDARYKLASLISLVLENSLSLRNLGLGKMLRRLILR